jgi:putative transposase
MKKSFTDSISVPACSFATVVPVALPPLAAVLSDVRSAFFDLCVQAGKEVLAAMMEAERVALCGPKGKPDPERRAGRGGHTRSWVTLDGRRIAIWRPRTPSVAGKELALVSFRWAAGADPLNEATLAAIASGVSSRRYASTLDCLPATEKQCSVSRSAVSRRFAAASAKWLSEWLSRSLAELDLPVVLLDGIHFRDRVLLVALGIYSEGHKHVLGLCEGSTENATVVKALLADLIERALDPERPRLCVIDGAKALRRALREFFGQAVLVQRCQVHIRGVLEHLPERLRPSVRRAMHDAWASHDPELALRQLDRLARSLAREHPGAAGSLREGLEETLTVQHLGIEGALLRTLRSTNPIENLNGAVAHYSRNVRRWRDGQMLLRWAGAALIEAARGFRRVRGYRDLPKLCAALERQRSAHTVAAERKVA